MIPFLLAAGAAAVILDAITSRDEPSDRSRRPFLPPPGPPEIQSASIALEAATRLAQHREQMAQIELQRTRIDRQAAIQQHALDICRDILLDPVAARDPGLRALAMHTLHRAGLSPQALGLPVWYPP